ncbi:hypothetical protein ACH4JS_01110 [Streptomyces sp. NPDC017638]|uniref:hypothetical protein n=1 Tax=Streptomyces sp. NPDC017638 TaxID=3365004 RepID=UPI0037B6D893
MNTEHPDHSGGPEERGTRRRRRRPTALAATLATAAVLLGGGGGGAYLAAGGGPDGRADDAAAPAQTRTPPPLALDDWTGTGTVTGGIAPGEPDPYGTRYVAAGELPDGPGAAPVYAPGARAGRERVARLAEALGMEGTPVAEGRFWRVGGRDGLGPVLTVRRDAPGDWSYSRYAPGTDNCRKVTVCSADPGAPAGDPVSAADARKAAAPVLEAAGLGAARTDASRVVGARRMVTADPVVGGLPTYGWTTGVSVGRGGEPTGGHGLSAAPVQGETYPVLGAARTLELLNGKAGGGHRTGIGGCASPGPAKERPCGTSAGARGTVTVDEAVLGLAAHTVGGRRTLVPSWLFRARASAGGEAFTVTYPAVDPAYLATASGAGSASPAPRPSGTGGTSPSVPVRWYTADGRTLRVGFSGGVCADYRVTARESGDRVAVTVTETPWPDRVCVLVAKEYAKTVTLHAPLDGRTVTGADGRAVPEAKPGAPRPDAPPRPR